MEVDFLKTSAITLTLVLVIASVGSGRNGAGDGWTSVELARLPDVRDDGVGYFDPTVLGRHVWVAATGRVFAGHGNDTELPIFRLDVVSHSLRRFRPDACHLVLRELVPVAPDTVVATHFNATTIESGSTCVSMSKNGRSIVWNIPDGVAPAYGAVLGANVLLVDPAEQSDPGHAVLFTRGGRMLGSYRFDGWHPDYVRGCSRDSAWISFDHDPGRSQNLFVHVKSGGPVIRKLLAIQAARFYCRDNGDLIGVSNGGTILDVSSAADTPEKVVAAGYTPKTDMIGGDMMLQSNATGQWQTLTQKVVPLSIADFIQGIVCVGRRDFIAVLYRNGTFSVQRLAVAK